MTRELAHPLFDVETHDEGLLIRFRVPGSRFGPVEVVMSEDEADDLAEALTEDGPA